MKILALLCGALWLALFPAIEAAEAASPRANVTASTVRAPSSAAERRAERLRLRRLRRDAVEERRQARMRGRTNTAAPRTERVIALTNQAREAEGLDALTWNPVLARTAQAYAEDMAKRGFFAHEDPDGRSSGERILAGGYAKPTCRCSWTFGTGENLAQGQDTPEEAVEDWLASPGHRANILRGDFEDIGVGYFDGHWVQHFGVSKVLP